LGTCAYCGRNAKLTREHLFPDSLAQKTPTCRAYIDHSRPKKPHRAVPIIRDVCTSCNNGPLSVLDSYGARLADKYFVTLLDSPTDVRFECDTERLLRWLLKLLFNDARATLGVSTDMYKKFVPFILGESRNPRLVLNLLVGAIAPFRLPSTGELCYPEHQGFANFTFSIPGAGSYFDLCRGVFLNSYVFVVLGWRPNVNMPFRKRLLRAIKEVNSLSDLHRPRASVRLTSSCMTTETIMQSTVHGGVQFSPFKT